MQNNLRKTGIDIIGNVPWSTHFCQFYQTKQDLIDMLVPYFKAGLENNEFCMCVTAEPLTAEEARQAISEVLLDFSKYLEKGQIEILPYTEWYTRGGSFNSQRVLNGWVEKLEAALAKGYDGLRLTGNTFWLEKSNWKSFTDYEAAVNGVIGKYKMLALCTYCLDKCNATEIIDVIRNHEFALIKQEGKWELVENSTYKSTKQALIESEEKLRQLYSSMSEGICLQQVIYDDSGQAVDYVIVDVNPAYESITGITKEKAIGRKASKLYGAGEPPYLDIYASVAATGRPTSFETYFPPMKKHLSISVFSPEKGMFGTVFSDITGRKQAEESLRKSEEGAWNQAQHLQAILDAAPAIIWIASDRECHSISGNRAAHDLLRIRQGIDMSKTGPAPELLAHYRVLKDGKELAPREMPIQRVAATGTSLRNYTMDLVFDDGSIRSVLGNITPILDSKGQPNGAVAAFIDITEHKLAEDALRIQEAELSAILESAPMLMLMLDTERRVLKANKAAADFAGQTVEGMIGLRAGEALRCLHKSDDPLGCGFGPACKTCLTRLIAMDTIETGQSHEQVECKFHRIQNGKLEEMTLLLYTVRPNLPEKRTLICIQDITSLKKTEEALRETSEYLNNLLNYANAPIIVWDPSFHITRFNHAFERLTGLPASEVIGKHLEILFPADSRKHSMEHIHSAVSGERMEIEEIPIQHKDGHVRTVLWNSATLYTADGKVVISTIAQGQDITERKKAEESIIQLNKSLLRQKAELEAANKELEAFSYSVSHDLRAPLRSSDGFSQALIEDYADKLDDQGKDYLRRIRQASQTMSQLIDDMLKLAQVTRAEMNYDKINLSHLVESVADRLKTSLPERRVEFLIAPDVEVYGDLPLLRIAIQNLLENAWKFTSKCPQAKIEFGVIDSDSKRTLFIRDNGVGFDMAYAAKLFMPFQRLHSNKEYPGTGIGLATVERIIRRHGGRIWTESNINQGTTFYFTL